MASKYNSKPVKRTDPSLKLDGGSPGKQFKMKEEQLTIPGLKLARMKKRTNNNVNET